MSSVERSRGARIRGRERQLEIQLGALAGFELRPTRIFVWTGEERAGRERVISMGTAPRSLMIPRRERELRAGALHVRSLGNPLMTIALASVHAVRAARRTSQGRLTAG
jgi:hypothetical protein